MISMSPKIVAEDRYVTVVLKIPEDSAYYDLSNKEVCHELNDIIDDSSRKVEDVPITICPVSEVLYGGPTTPV
jgi:hypothetical protein